MPSKLHESLVELFRQQPSLAAELLTRVLGLGLPAYEQVRVEPGDCTHVVPTEYRADVVVLLAADVPVVAVVVEVQLNRDSDKQWSWPVYVTTLRARHRCPAALLVMCVDPAVATWCGAPIDIGPGVHMVPTVIGPDRVPLIIDPGEAARAPEMAVLSALAHGGSPSHRDVLPALLGALEAVDDRRATLYADLVHLALPAAARRHLEALVSTGTYEPKSEFVRRYWREGRAEGRTEGRAKGEARAVLDVLNARGIAVPEQVRRQVAECTDLDQLDVWVRRAATAEKIEDLFE